MVRMILAIIAGFAAWSILWIGSDEIFGVISPDWGKKSKDFQKAAEGGLPYTIENSVLIILLIKSFIVSIISGFVTAWIARENFKSTLIMGILLLVFGIFVQCTYWNYMPLWYHIPFLLMLIPMTILGGKLKKI